MWRMLVCLAYVAGAGAADPAVFLDPHVIHSSFYHEREAEQSHPGTAARCPPAWLRRQDSCYRLVKSPSRARHDARGICQAYGADLASINSIDEHGWMVRQLSLADPQHGAWYVSARQASPLHWNNEDGSQLAGLDDAFLHDTDSRGDFLVYRYSVAARRWGLDHADGSRHLRFICEGDVHRIALLDVERRSFEYGETVSDPERVPRGPFFTKQPEDVIYDTSSGREAVLICIAGGFPAPTYRWYREDYDLDNLVDEPIDPLLDSRFTVSGGSFFVHEPEPRRDAARYHCTASNKFGTIRSQSVLLSFGFIREFNSKRAAEAGNQYWGKVMYCDPPAFYPAVSYNWARGNFPNLVEEDQRVFVSNDGGLYFSALETIDRGNYSCNVQSAVSNRGRNGPFFPLSVYSHSDYQQLKFPNSFPKMFPEAPVVGQEVRLECVAHGYPVPSYNWTRSGANLPRGAVITSFGRVLTLPRVSVEDEGEYVCQARNDRAAIDNSVYLKVQAAPEFTIPLADKHADVRSDLYWNCEAFGIPDVNYTWWRNGQRLHVDALEPADRDRYTIRDNVLVIRRLETRDRGMYQCEARNQLQSTFSSAQLRVLSLQPSFEKSPLESETYGSVGGNVTLACNPEAAPKPTFTWKKDNDIIGSGGKRIITEDGRLTIRQLSRDDEGVYTCVAKNPLGSDESKGRLVVLRAPNFVERLPARATAQAGDNLFLHCAAETDPLLDIAYVWLHNGIRVKDRDLPFRDETFRDRRLNAEGGVLSLYGVSLSDAGLYECVVESAIGRISSETTLTVEGPPGAPGGLRVIDVQQNKVTLQWADGADNGRPILHYEVSGRTNWNATWTSISDHVNAEQIDRYNDRKEATVTDALVPWSVYEFRVRAVNALGAGSASAPSPQFSTPPDRPHMAPSDVGGGGGKIGDLTITWRPLPPAQQHAAGIYYKIYWRRRGHDTEYQSMDLRDQGNIHMQVVHVSPDYFFSEYEVKVQALNSVGAGPESAPALVYSAEDMPQVSPQSVSALAYNSTALNVTWEPVDRSRARLRGHLIGHRLKYWKEGNKEEDSIYYLSRSTNSWSLIVGLQPDTYYYVKVMAFNSAGEGPESERYRERTFRAAPHKPPASVQVFGVNPSTVRVVWRYVQPSQDEEPLRGYKVRVWEKERDMSTANDTVVGVESRLEAYVRDLTPGNSYMLRVLAFSNGGDGRMSSPPFVFQMGDYHSDALGYRASAAPRAASTIFLFFLAILHILYR